MNPVVHFEMGYQDKERMVKFYTQVFHWKANEMGPEMGNYVVVHTGETDTNGMPSKPGFINGGLYQKTENPLSHAPSVVVSVPDIQKSMQDIVNNGGKILGSMNSDGGHSYEPQHIPGVGLWISTMDTEGNRISILQTKGI